MSEKKEPVIIIRADGNEVLGMGHLMRCMSIGKAFQKQGAKCVFLVAQEKAGAFVREKGFVCEVLHTDFAKMETEFPHIEATVNKYKPNLWLVDSYQVTDKYILELQKSCPVFVLDDMGERTLNADGIINYNIYGDKLRYTKAEKMKCLLGAKYAPVREEFSEVPYVVREKVSNVLITMGGSDKLDITGALCKSLLEGLPKEIDITLICGRFNPHLQELLLLQEAEERVHVLVDVTDMWNRLAMADVVVSAAGSTMYELSTMGVPTVCCYYVENQRRLAEGFAEKVGLCNAGDYSRDPGVVLQKMEAAVCELVDDGEQRRKLSRRMQDVTDGQGAARIATELLTFIK